MFAPMGAVVAIVVIVTILQKVLRCIRRCYGRFVTFGLLTVVHRGIFTSLEGLYPTGLRNESGKGLVSVVAASVRLLRIFCTRAVSPVTVTALASVVVMVFVKECR